MLKNFRAYQSAVQLYKICEKAWGPKHLQDQLSRAASSVVLNLAEGSERASNREKRRFYLTAMASLRETQAILELLPESTHNEQARRLADQAAGSVFRLCQSTEQRIKTAGPDNGSQETDNGEL